MTLSNPTFQQEQRMTITRILTWMSKNYQNYLTDTGAIDAELLGEAAAWNFGIWKDWAQELAEQFQAGKEGAK